MLRPRDLRIREQLPARGEIFAVLPQVKRELAVVQGTICIHHHLHPDLSVREVDPCRRGRA